MNYWFLYRLDGGAIFGAPYLGYTEEWTNIPDGCGVIGPIEENDEIAIDVAKYPEFYNVVDGQLQAVSNIDELKANIPEYVPPKSPEQLRIEQLEAQIASLQNAIDALISVQS
ncbi:hypothetical protein [Paenibacillus xylaniclasticus]|uniref:hypothetical protein n=1 Tax=Paenibacillus xylaniclasticus TaxID=588083 RepID=UPI000FD84718|nr:MULTISPECIES: hypothetical protein [Paenibacillus]GFN32612.1 hypothetical protein PCURB6_28720 [Paenibacillus curdlanolyticus]